MSKWFYVINLDDRQSRQANNSASIVRRAKERDLAIVLEKAQQEAKWKRRDYRKSESVNKLFLPA